jgi:hypothetical protein
MENILKTINNGNLTVTNVPYTPYELGYGPDGSKEFLTADVVYNLAKIFDYMLKNNVLNIDYSEYEYIH